MDVLAILLHETRFKRIRICSKHMVIDPSVCPHIERDHYSKNMCKACYNYKGRVKKSTNCPHTEMLAYAQGKCYRCYNNSRNHLRQSKRELKLMEKRSAILQK
jgi:hypothetical protein